MIHFLSVLAKVEFLRYWNFPLQEPLHSAFHPSSIPLFPTF